MSDYKEKILSNIRKSTDRSIEISEIHLSELRRLNIEWLINVVKKCGDNEYHLQIIITIMIIDELISACNILINKALYLSAYILAAELIKPKSVDISVFARFSKINIDKIIKLEILIIKNIPYLYEIVSESPIINALDEYDNEDILKIGLLLMIYYTDTYYSDDTDQLIIDIYLEKKKLKDLVPLTDYDINIIN
jgi:hypothetical protein